jgi:hypothetical protein
MALCRRSPAASTIPRYELPFAAPMLILRGTNNSHTLLFETVKDNQGKQFG